MNGKRILLDTNAIISLLKGNKFLLNLAEKSAWVGLSIISKIEFPAYSGLSKVDTQLL